MDSENRAKLKKKIKAFLKETTSTAIKMKIARVAEEKVKKFIKEHHLIERLNNDASTLRDFLFSSAAVSAAGGNMPSYCELRYEDCPEIFREIAFPVVPGGIPCDVAGEAGAEFLNESVKEAALSLDYTYIIGIIGDGMIDDPPGGGGEDPPEPHLEDGDSWWEPLFDAFSRFSLL